MNILLYVCILVPMALIDAVWLFTMGGTYREMLGHLFAPQFNFVPAVIFYLIYALGIMYFVANPALISNSSFLKTFLIGAFLGLLAYGTYDLTNHATLRDWPIMITVIDMIWGAVVTGLASAISVAIFKMFR